jgi:GNAT superfamily N-acetyltransferase
VVPELVTGGDRVGNGGVGPADADRPDTAIGAPPAVTVDRVGPGGGVASDSAFGVALVTLWQTIAESGEPVGFPVPVVRADIAARAASLVDEVRTGRLIAVAANRQRRLVGVGLLRPGRGSQQHTGRIELLLVGPEHQRAGLGSRLLAELLARAGERGLERLEVAIPDGAELARFFARFGFAEWGRRPGWIKMGDDDVRAEVVMGAEL